MSRTARQRLEALAGGASRWFALLVIAGAVAGYIWPVGFGWVLRAPAEWFPGKPIEWLLGIIMLGMGMTLTAADFRRVLQRPWDIGVGLVAQYGIMSAGAWLLARVLGLPPELAVGVVLVGTCPGGTASNVITYMARGDVALSVSMTTASTLAAPILTPLLTLWLAGAQVPVNATGMFVSIVQIVVAPVALGVLARHFLSRAVESGVRVLPLVSVAAIVLIVAAVVGASREKILQAGALVFAAVILHNAFGLALGYGAGWAARMDETRRRALCVEVGMQNSGLAATLAATHFTPAAALPAAIFSVWHNITGPMLASIWAKNRKGI